mgnify:FL=1
MSVNINDNFFCNGQNSGNDNTQKFRFHDNYERKNSEYLLINRNGDVVKRMTAYEIKKEYGINNLRLYIRTYGPTPILDGLILIEADVTQTNYKTFFETDKYIYYICTNGKFLRYTKENMEREIIEPEYSTKLDAFFTVIEGGFFINAYEVAKAFRLIKEHQDFKDVCFSYMDGDKSNTSLSNLVARKKD